MDYPTFGIPWTVFTQFNDRNGSYVDVDSGSVGSTSPPPSPMSPSPSLTSYEDESTFHFLPSASGNQQQQQLCYEVPALLGLENGSTKSSKSTGSPRRSPSSGNGFYKRLLEWLSRKKKSHVRRYSEVVLPEICPLDPNCRQGLHGLMAVPVGSRNQSAPMIFDIHYPSAPTGSAAVRIEVQQPAERPLTASPPSSPGITMMIPTAPPATPTTPTFSEDSAKATLDPATEIDAEWIIPWTDIQIGPVVSRRGSCTINRGRWHGDVILHQFKLQSSEEVGSFWSEVQSLSKLRHENLLLFMGIATMDDEENDSVAAAEHNKESLNCYTIVNSAPRGVSVANFRLGSVKNGKPERIGMRAAVSIARQVAQATGYLHARGIVHGKISPHNIFLEGENYRVKLSLLDHGQIETTTLQVNYGCLPKMQLSYYSPELIRSIVVRPPELCFFAQSTKFSDVYALGSFMYDLIAGSPPFHQEEVDSIVWRIGTGQTTQLIETKCNDRLKALILSCWSFEAEQRPSCVEVVRRLQPSALLCRSHSCSEPERLNRLGMCKLAC